MNIAPLSPVVDSPILDVPVGQTILECGVACPVTEAPPQHEAPDLVPNTDAYLHPATMLPDFTGGTQADPL